MLPARGLHWDLPGDDSTCNDFYPSARTKASISPTPATACSIGCRPAPPAAELYLKRPTTRGRRCCTFLDGTLYVNNVFFNKLYRITVDSDGKPRSMVDIWMDQPVRGPDGMRAANGKLYLAENSMGITVALTVLGDKAAVTVVKDGLRPPTGDRTCRRYLWFTRRIGGGRFMPAK